MKEKSEEESLRETIEYVKMREGHYDKPTESEPERLLKSINKHLYAIRSFLVLGAVMLFLLLLK